jgi:segregation and condensation protein B
MTLDAQLEAILFAVGGSMSIRRLAEVVEQSPSAIEAALLLLEKRLAVGSGLQVTRHGNEVELVTHPEAAEWVRRVAKAEAHAEFSKASLETLSILAYRGPLTRPELEQIRGVQSAVILRNLMLRGVVEAREESRLGQPVYQVTMEFVKHLGLTGLEELPDFASLHAHPTVEQVLDQLGDTREIPKE